MKVHHVNCGQMRPYGGRLVDGRGTVLSRAETCCHVLVVETGDGLVLVDSGLGLGDVRHPPGSLPLRFRVLSRPTLNPDYTAVRQLRRLGYQPDDVRHIVLTHLDLDHAGGLRDFPHATVHLHADELAAGLDPPTTAERRRYRQAQWAHGPAWSAYRADGERWYGFEAVRDLPGLPPEILLIPLAGHTRGHTAVAVRTADRWLLHAGDAYFFRGEMDPVAPRGTPLLDAFQKLIQVDGAARVGNQHRLRELVRDHGDEITVFSAHDAVELAKLSAPAGAPQPG